MKRILSLLAAVCLLMSLGVSARAEDKGWIDAYSAILNEHEAMETAGAEEFFDSLSEYTLYDIDKDGTPELILKLGTCEADFHGEIYSYADGQTRCVCSDLGLGHSALYTYPESNGVVVMYGHMGYAWAMLLRIGADGSIGTEDLYEDDLNERLQSDPEADYVYPGDVIPGSAYLNLYRLEKRLPLTRYEEIMGCLEGRFPGEARNGTYPQGDPYFFEKVLQNNTEVVAVSADGYTRSPGRIGFQDLLKQDAAADWMYADLQIVSTCLADLNSDGQAECIVDLNQGEGSEPMRFFLSEENGTVYAYLQNYAPSLVSVDWNGNLHCAYYTSSELCRLFFDGEEAFFLWLPMEYLAQ